MENIFNDWKFYAFIFQVAVTVIGFAIIKFNDFSHLEKDVKAINKREELIIEKLTSIDKKVAVLEERTK